MSRRGLVLTVVLGILNAVLAVGIVRTLTVTRALPPPTSPQVVIRPVPTTRTENAELSLSDYHVIVGRNPFNSARSEATVSTAPVSKPILHGVVIDGEKSRAFLEDLATRRVAGYSVGDMIGGGRIQQITDDGVAIVRPEGLFVVLLRDPSKPRVASVSAVSGQQAPPAVNVAQDPQASPAIRAAPAQQSSPAPPTPTPLTPRQLRRRALPE